MGEDGGEGRWGGVDRSDEKGRRGGRQSGERSRRWRRSSDVYEMGWLDLELDKWA